MVGILFDVLTDADRTLAELAASQDSVFTLADAARAGLTHDQVRARVAHDWITCHDGVFRMPGAAESWRGRLRAATMAAAPHGYGSHRSAAVLYELPGGRKDFAELSCHRWLRAKHPELLVHESVRLLPDDVDVVDGIPVTRPERVVFDLASIWPSADFLETVIHAARRKRLITYGSMHATYARNARRGVRGVRALRTALERWNPDRRPTESEMETLLLQVLRGHGFPELTPQFEVRLPDGTFVARVDAAIPEWRIVIEYDSKQEHSDEFQIERDARRRNRVIAAGYSPLVARYRDLVTGGRELSREIIETHRNLRRNLV